MTVEIDFKKLEKELIKIPCPIVGCNLYPDSIGLNGKNMNITTNCDHDEHFTSLINEYVRLKKEQRKGTKP